MEDFTLDIENMLEKKLVLYKQLNGLLKEEREFIVNIDIDSLWKTAELKKKTAAKIQDLKENIFLYLKTRFNLNDISITSFSISYLIRTIHLPESFKIKLKKIKLAIENEKNELAQVAFENKKYVQEYLCIIDDVMSVAVENSRHAQYDLSGTMPGTPNSNHLIHAQV